MAFEGCLILSHLTLYLSVYHHYHQQQVFTARVLLLKDYPYSHVKIFDTHFIDIDNTISEI